MMDLTLEHFCVSHLTVNFSVFLYPDSVKGEHGEITMVHPRLGIYYVYLCNSLSNVDIQSYGRGHLSGIDTHYDFDPVYY